MNKKLFKNLCPCGNNSEYNNCCGQWHKSTSENYLKAASAEQLMRSRYSAFVLKLEKYLLDTWHSSTRPQGLEFTHANTKWIGLEVKTHIQQDENHATVEFMAKSKINGKAHTMHENSKFVRENGIWFYMEGVSRIS